MDHIAEPPPSYGNHYQHALLPPPYYSQEYARVAVVGEMWTADGILSSGRGRSSILSRFWRWIAKELASSTVVLSNGKNSDMCLGACCRG
ncbi:hypothetical protein M419DRAFT_92430 [Trichoderma reesei RUT C-30]|uniref:Uncharacterized protein n=1 Tax=Hypocrea jecorina (strain ATCC 56765 / BCRC 32924 / NRRL 11460 / Rut C-30) TaxID=1344414 RepID=A0A024RVA6_HYPJR|nr:hypothetical protein M419DRAFT_92430 [Trichoderma reesei RUT C-30]